MFSFKVRPYPHSTLVETPMPKRPVEVDDDDDYYEDDRPRRRRDGPEKSGGVAAILEVIPGILISTFGIGHMYAGKVGVGLVFMFGYWFVLSINILLCFVGVGFFTLPLCWLATIVISSILASNSCKAR